MKVAFLTLGCKINQFYTSCIKEEHLRNGDIVVPLEENPDIAYINTCSVTTHAGHESRKAYRKAKRYAKEIKIAGCHGKLFPEEFADADCVEESDWLLKYSNPPQNRTRSYLPIQTGCNDFCTYCIVPYARGKSHSLPPEIVIKNLKKRISDNYKEVILTGIHIGSYLYNETDLTTLLKDLLQFNIRIRLSSIKPNVIDRRFLELFRYENLMPHLHLSVQSGDNTILKRMGRTYTREKTLWIARELQKIRDDVRLAGDFMVGFPGERDVEFNNTVELIKKANFSHLHIFRYSKRPYTLASLFPDQVPDSTKKERSRILLNLGRKQRDNFIRKQIGKRYRVTIEDISPNGKDWVRALTPNYIRIHLPNTEKFDGVVSIKIKRFEKGYVYAEIQE
ncbi:MiaB/RimO family radical SAM methylthiotransferase [candidate division WOR-3 bacterium]|nr:MiaB/RimO family radical SAM methylthiotransferase [candidate division WOR-3 bacterium]